jgi:hypothetical protein
VPTDPSPAPPSAIASAVPPSVGASGPGSPGTPSEDPGSGVPVPSVDVSDPDVAPVVDAVLRSGSSPVVVEGPAVVDEASPGFVVDGSDVVDGDVPAGVVVEDPGVVVVVTVPGGAVVEDDPGVVVVDVDPGGVVEVVVVPAGAVVVVDDVDEEATVVAAISMPSMNSEPPSVAPTPRSRTRVSDPVKEVMSNVSVAPFCAPESGRVCSVVHDAPPFPDTETATDPVTCPWVWRR